MSKNYSTKIIFIVFVGISVVFSFSVIESNMNFQLNENNITMDEDIKVKTAVDQDLYPEEFFYSEENIPLGAEFTPRKVLVDSHDNVYVSGSLYWASNGTHGMLVAKLNSYGTLMWQKIRFEPADLAQVADMVIDSNENLYIAAYAGLHVDNMYLYKYNSSGSLKWNQTWDPGSNAKAEEMAIDEFNNLYIVGYTGVSGKSNEFCIIKYNDAGDQIWNVTYGGTDHDYGLDIAISEFGNIYVLGSTLSYGLGGKDVWFFEINSNGNMLWNKTFGTTGGEYPSEIVVDSLSNIYIQTAFNDKFDIFKFSSSGDYISNSSLSRPSYAVVPAYEEMIIRDDSIYVLRDIGRLLKFNTSCEFLWETKRGPYRTISLDSKSNIFVALVNSIDDGFIMKLSSAPFITINITENQVFTHQAPQFNLTVLDPDFDSAWYSLDNGLTNFSIDGTEGAIDQEEWDTLDDGYTTIDFFANDTLGHIGKRELTVFKDTEAPSIILYEPIQDAIYGSTPPNYSVLINGSNLEFGDDIHSCWYYIQEINDGVTIYSGSISIHLKGTINSNLWNEVPEGLVTISFGVKDVFGNERFINVTVEKKIPRGSQFPIIPTLTIIGSTIGGVSLVAITWFIVRKRRKLGT